MDTAELCRSLTELMERQAALLEHMVSYEITLKESIVAHNFTGLELAQRKMSPILNEIAAAEAARHAAFLKLQVAVGEGPESGFYEVLSHLDRATREKAADAYRTLKFTVLKIQGLTDSIDIYLTTVTAAMQEVLSELFPFQKGNIYTRRGTKRQAQANPMLISRRL